MYEPKIEDAYQKPNEEVSESNTTEQEITKEDKEELEPEKQTD